MLGRREVPTRRLSYRNCMILQLLIIRVVFCFDNRLPSRPFSFRYYQDQPRPLWPSSMPTLSVRGYNCLSILTSLVSL
ncbi:hypothetical protein F5Y12DRAFT_757363 [Xylaria sp. FL1777]|nr:hypothetical protein F5Y12DRAFT_757363 [Xylaria sp. FL1777]